MHRTLTKEVAFSISEFLSISTEKIRIKDTYINNNNIITLNGVVDLNYLQISFLADVNQNGDGYILFQLVPFESVKIENENEFNGSEGVWEFEIRNWKICNRYTKYGI